MSDWQFPAFYHREGDWLVAYESARGPWSPDHCHAGPVTGVLAGAAETALSDKQLVRVTASFYRPVPMAGVRVSTEVVRNGRMASTVRVTLTDRNDKAVAGAECLLLQTVDHIDVEDPILPGPNFDDATRGEFGVKDLPHGEKYFGNANEIAYPPGEDEGPGPTTIWMRALPIIEGEETTAFQRACPLSDCANGYSRNAEFTTMSCVNPDLTVTLHRLPESEWIAAAGRSIWKTNGIGMTRATLFDERGEIGTAIQTLLLR
jgi:acyl-CoA thioesterase